MIRYEGSVKQETKGFIPALVEAGQPGQQVG